MANVITALAVLLALISVLPLLRSGAWWIRIFDFPRIQITIISALVFLLYFYFAGADTNVERFFIILLAACFLYQCYMMYPYTIFARKQVQSSANRNGEAGCRLLCANVLMKNRNAAKLREIIRRADPDVILAVETDKWWQQQLRDFEATHPFTVHYLLGNTYGMPLYSRFELRDAEVKFLVEDDIPSIHALMKLPDGTEVALHCLHPRPPFPTEAMQSTERDAELLIVGRNIKRRDAPTIVMGDLNDVAWSHTNYLFQDISGLLDPRIGRGFFNTFHAQVPFFRFPLDHFFHSNHFRLLELKRLPRFGSDHFPVLVALSYEPDAVRAQEELHADTAQVEEAEEKIAQATE